MPPQSNARKAGHRNNVRPEKETTINVAAKANIAASAKLETEPACNKHGACTLQSTEVNAQNKGLANTIRRHLAVAPRPSKLGFACESDCRLRARGLR